MTRTLTDAAILLGALTGSDPRDLATEASAGKYYSTTPTSRSERLRGASAWRGNFLSFSPAQK
jgi:hypothetical protein